MVWRGHATRASSRSTSPFRGTPGWHCHACASSSNKAHWKWCGHCHAHWSTKEKPNEASPSQRWTPNQSKWGNGPPASLGLKKPLPTGTGTGKGSVGRKASRDSRPPAHQSEATPSSQTTQAGEAETLTTLKTKLVGLQAQMTSLQGVAGSDAMVLLLRDLATTLEDRIAELTPSPKATSPHAQSQTLQWKIARKTTQVQGLTEKTQHLRATLKPLRKQYDSANERLTELRTQWHQVGPTLMDLPSPLRSDEETISPEGSDATDSLLGEEDKDIMMNGAATGGEAGPGVKRRLAQTKRRRGPIQAPFPLRSRLPAVPPAPAVTIAWWLLARERG